MRMVLIGPAGAGKGTQGARLAERLQLKHIAIGDMLRSEIAARTPIGTRIAGLVSTGRLVPDDLVEELLAPNLGAASEGFILDGFPRTREQARSLDRSVRLHGAEIEVALVFRIPRAALVERLLLRNRPDDTSDIIKTRLDGYERSESEILDHYRGRVIELDALGDPEDVEERALFAIREHLAG